MSGFIEFSLNSLLRQLGDVAEAKVVCFSDTRHTEDAVEIKVPSDLPDEWSPGYGWLSLNMLKEAILATSYDYRPMRLVEGKVDKARLLRYIRAFGFEPEAKCFLHVWKCRVKKNWRKPNEH